MLPDAMSPWPFQDFVAWSVSFLSLPQWALMVQFSQPQNMVTSSKSALQLLEMFWYLPSALVSYLIILDSTILCLFFFFFYPLLSLLLDLETKWCKYIFLICHIKVEVYINIIFSGSIMFISRCINVHITITQLLGSQTVTYFFFLTNTKNNTLVNLFMHDVLLTFEIVVFLRYIFGNIING